MAKREVVAVTFKARPELKEWLIAEAKKGFRSVSAEIAMRLERVMAEGKQDSTGVQS